MDATPPTIEQAAAAEQAAEIAADLAGLDLNGRLWLRSLEPVLQLRCGDPDASPRVQHALDLVLVAAAERAVRVLGSDLSADHADAS